MQEINIKTLLLIGNGYDLSFGMKTSYRNFVQSELFKKILPQNKLASYIYNSFAENNYKWVDVEIELAKYSQYLSKGEIDDSKLEENFRELSNTLKEYLQNHTGGKENSKMKKCIREWYEYAESNKNIEVISFNYTHKVTTDFFNDYKIHVNYIHGRITDNIVLGVDESSNLAPRHRFLYKSYNPNIQIKEVLDKITSANHFIIFGCSIGETDEFYFKNVFKSTSKKTFQIYYYGEDEEINIKNRIESITGNMTTFISNNDVTFINSKELSINK